MPKISTLLICFIGIFCTCETRTSNSYLTISKCPYSMNPITYEDFVRQAGSPDDVKSKKYRKYWKRCLLPNFSCAKIRISDKHFIFTCLSDYGAISPTFFKHEHDAWTVTYDPTVSLAKGCGFLGTNNVTERTHTTITFNNSTFVTELVCCKGDPCSGTKWKRIWGDASSLEKMDVFWYTSISVSATLFCLITIKISLIAYQRLKERLVINALKTISPTLKEADDEDQSKQRTAIMRMFRLRRRQRNGRTENETSSEITNSVKALLKGKIKD